MEKVQSSTEGQADEEVLQRVLYEEQAAVPAAAASPGAFATLPAGTLNGNLRVNGSQPVVHLSALPFAIRNHTFAAALRSRCQSPKDGAAATNFSALREAYDSSSFLVANQDFRAAGTS
ncbi:unnamed protein product, partial [Effrenium voratum]